MNLKHFVCAYTFDLIKSNNRAINLVQAEFPSRLIVVYAHQTNSVFGPLNFAITWEIYNDRVNSSNVNSILLFIIR